MVWKLTSDSRISARALERQMSNWELARRQRLSSSRPRAEVEDFITISRQAGIPAERIAEVLSKHFGWPVFGRGLLESMAGDDSVRRRIYRSMDERDVRWWEEALRGLLDKEFNVNDYFHRLSHTVLSLARQSPCIFVGRGCDFILPRHLGLRVRLVAPLEPRIEAVAEERDCSPEAARHAIEQVRTERLEYLNRHFGDRAFAEERADLVINLGRWDADSAIEVILEAYQKRLRPVATAVS